MSDKDYKDYKDTTQIRIDNNAYESLGGIDENDYVVAVYENPIKKRLKRTKAATETANKGG